ncbi:DUF3316 domain-containing protein [Vibrio sp. TRT 21S02]|uniref:DUF3316 domain-containing protein n=1 Tax=unclassified Vibrio TaxID=2614977 RepID=UPI00349F3906
MIKAISLFSALLFSSMTVAGLSGHYSKIVNTDSVNGQVVASKDAALEAGRDMLMDINNKSPYELSKAVNYSANDKVDPNSFEVRNSTVSVKEIVTSEGEIAYQPVISVNYEYRARERN